MYENITLIPRVTLKLGGGGGEISRKREGEGEGEKRRREGGNEGSLDDRMLLCEDNTSYLRKISYNLQHALSPSHVLLPLHSYSVRE